MFSRLLRTLTVTQRYIPGDKFWKAISFCLKPNGKTIYRSSVSAKVFFFKSKSDSIIRFLFFRSSRKKQDGQKTSVTLLKKLRKGWIFAISRKRRSFGEQTFFSENAPPRIFKKNPLYLGQRASNKVEMFENVKFQSCPLWSIWSRFAKRRNFRKLVLKSKELSASWRVDFEHILSTSEPCCTSHSAVQTFDITSTSLLKWMAYQTFALGENAWKNCHISTASIFI